MKKRRVLALVREGLEPPDNLEGITDEEIDFRKAEFDVVHTLREMGHDVQVIGVYNDLAVLNEPIKAFKPHLVFMLLEEFHGIVTYDYAIVSYLELIRQKYTGCNPRGLMLSRDKALCKKILAYHRLPTPPFTVFPIKGKGRRPKRLQFPLFVKSVMEDASFGISQASIVHNDESLRERVRFIHEHAKTDALVEQYIDGRELYVGVIGNTRLQAFPPWEMIFKNMPPEMFKIATSHVKFNRKYQERNGIETKAAENLPPGAAEKMMRVCKKVYKALGMSGYARMDLRMTDEGKIYVIEANANPNMEYGEDFSEAADNAGLDYEALLQRILTLGLSYKAAWQKTVEH